MCFKAFCAAVLAAIAIAGCGSTNDTPAPSTPPSVTAAPANPVQATVNTRPTTDCAREEATKPGNCWLPLYTEPSYISPTSHVINLRETADSPCRTPGKNGAPLNSQVKCWPQPDTEVTVVCRRIDPGSGVLWYAVNVPRDNILDSKTPIGTLGWNKANFLIVDNPTSVADCQN